MNNEELKKYAESLGFEYVWFRDDNTFVAEVRGFSTKSLGAITVRRDEKYEGKIEKEITWSSGGRGTTIGQYQQHVKMLNNAIKIYAKL